MNSEEEKSWNPQGDDDMDEEVVLLLSFYG